MTVAASLLLPFLLFQLAGPAEELQRGKNAFDRGEFKRAVEIVHPLLYPDLHLHSESQIVQAHRILGVSYLFERQHVAAKGEFRKLLQLSPDFRFDPLLDPPQVVDFFNTVRRDYETEVVSLEEKRKQAEKVRLRGREDCEKSRGPTVIEKRVARNSFIVNFVPFGAGQFQNGHRGKGWAFLTAETVLGAVSVAALATNLAVYGFRPQRTCRYDLGDAACPPNAIDHTDEDRSRWLTRVQVASGAMFLGVALWGIVDALVYHQPTTDLALSDGAAVPAARSLRLAPALMERGVGAGLSFRF